MDISPSPATARTRIAAAVALLAVSFAVLTAQGNDPASKRRELKRVTTEIGATRALAHQAEQRAREAASRISLSKERAAILDSLLGEVEREERRLALHQIALRETRDSLGGILEEIVSDHARVARALFRQRLLLPEQTALLLPTEHAGLALRSHLLERFSREQRERVVEIRAIGLELERRDSILDRQQRAQATIAEARRAEIERIEQVARRHAADLDAAIAEKAAFNALLERREREARQVERMIATLAAESRQQRDQAKRTEPANAGGKATVTSPDRGGGRSASRDSGTRGNAAAPEAGKQTAGVSENVPAFNWPVAGRKIVTAYGERVNRNSGTVTLNPGIDIAARKGSAVKAALSGTVSLVSWLPGYGTLVIVEHKGGYRTVYANLAAASVSKGRRVATGDRIGTVGRSSEGEYLHFEVWKGQQRLDPESVL